MKPNQDRSGRFRRRWITGGVAGLLLAGPPAGAQVVHETTGGPPEVQPIFFSTLRLAPEIIEVVTPVNTVTLSVQPVNSIAPLQAVAGPAPGAEFSPPSFFSAPLPTGSGARALGFSGAFTATADDATAASWNPAGLINLESPEASVVFRVIRVENKHRSSDPDFDVDSSSYSSEGLNYLSLAYPFYLPYWDRNLVISLNHQEAYDFRQRFSSRTRQRDARRSTRRRSATASAEQRDHYEFEGGLTRVDVLSRITTRSSSVLEQTFESELESRLRFNQEGVIEATTPAFAFEVTPKFFIGGAVNVYQDGGLNGRRIRSQVDVDYSGLTRSTSRSVNRQETTVDYTTETVIRTPPSPFFPSFDIALPTTEGSAGPFVNEEVVRSSETRRVEGSYRQIDRFDDVHGVNTTIGALLTVNRFLFLGAMADLPWAADSTQTRIIRDRQTIYNADRTRVLDTRDVLTSERREATFEFPLFWNVGAVLRFNDHSFASLDAGRTHWSDFAYDVEGQGKINPFDGSPHGENPVDDTWSWRVGFEYLFLKDDLEIPVRLGLVREERPAIGSPDVYQGFSVGSGISFPLESGGKLILDVAYGYLAADDIQTVLPDNPALSTDTEQHQGFISLIWHQK